MSAVRRTVAVPQLATGNIAYARYRHIDDGLTIFTNDAGAQHMMKRADAERLLAGQLPESSPEVAALDRLGFLRSAPRLDVLADRLRDRRGYLMIGTSLLGLDTSTIDRSIAGLQAQIDSRLG